MFIMIRIETGVGVPEMCELARIKRREKSWLWGERNREAEKWRDGKVEVRQGSSWGLHTLTCISILAFRSARSENNSTAEKLHTRLPRKELPLFDQMI